MISVVAAVLFQTRVRAQNFSGRPALDLWRKLRDALTDTGGEQKYFSQIEGALIPPGDGWFDGTVVSLSSQTDLIVNVDNTAGDAALKFEHPLRGAVRGTLIQFRGVIDSYTKEPYMLRLLVVDEDVRLKVSN